MAILKNTTITDNGYLQLPRGTTSQRPLINTTIAYWTTAGYTLVQGATQTQTSTSWTCPTGVTAIDVLLVGGGGGGGFGHGGGGGGGAVLYKERLTVTPSTVYNFTIGAGGAGHTSDASSNVGGSTTAFGVTATGGGGGANESTAVGSGGANGGGGTYGYANGATGTRPTAAGWTVFAGNSGGQGGINGANYPCGGGAGAGGNGGAGRGGDNSAAGNGTGGGGGPGIMIDILGTPYYWAAGGGGVTYDAGGYAGAGGIGGGGGASNQLGTSTTPFAGGNGGLYGLNSGGAGTVASDGTGAAAGAHTGSGGGGGANENGVGGAGAGGIVVIRYVLTADNEDPIGLARFNTELKGFEVYEGASKGWISQDPTRNFAGHNLLNYSEQFNSYEYSRGNVNVTANATTAPNGTSTADKVFENSSNARHELYHQTTTVNGALYTYSLYVKPAGRNYCAIAYNGGTIAGFDLTGTGTFIPNTATVGSITALPQGWFRISITAVATSTTNVYICIRQTSGNTVETYTGDGSNGLFVWGAQLERANTMGPYTRTQGAIAPTPGIQQGYRTHTYSEFGKLTMVTARCYHVTTATRSANYTVQWSDDGSSWTTAFGGVMAATVPGYITGTVTSAGSGTTGDGTYGAHTYWRYVEGSTVSGHHPRVSKVYLTDSSGIEYMVANFGYDNHTDRGVYQVGTLSAFISPAATSFTPAVSGTVEVLVVAGGGGGGRGQYSDGGGGGGGGGGVIYNGSFAVVSGTTYTVTVGNGGAGAQGGMGDGTVVTALRGGNSQFGPLIAIGGGGGKSQDGFPGEMGGSGGGGAGGGSPVAGGYGPGIIGQGNPGGRGGAGPYYSGGGGGGAGQWGQDGPSGYSPGIGGSGAMYAISGSPVFYGGGGGGGTYLSNLGYTGKGGRGGGGDGGETGSGSIGTAGTDRLGGGGGGGTGKSSGQNLGGARGGSGVVIVRYRYD